MILTKDKALVVPKREHNGQLLFGRQDAPIAPNEIAEEVEAYARESGRHGSIRWVPYWNCWVVRLTRRSNDPVLAAVAKGRVELEESHEMVPLQYWDGGLRKYMSYDIHSMGASGVRTFLEKGNTWSGRGQWKSLEQCVRSQRDKRIAGQEKLERDARLNARDRALDQRRQLLGIPYLPVGIDIKEMK